MESQNTVYSLQRICPSKDGLNMSSRRSEAIHRGDSMLHRIRAQAIFMIAFVIAVFGAQLADAQKKAAAKPAPKDTTTAIENIVSDTPSAQDSIPPGVEVVNASATDTGAAKGGKKFMTGADQVKAYATFLKG